MSDPLDHIHQAVGELHPGASPATDYIWQATYVDGTAGPPEMVFWDEGRLGPLDMSGLQAKCAEIALRLSVPLSVSDRQFSQYLAETGEITWEEHFAWLEGHVPQAFLTKVALIPDELTRNRAISFLKGATIFERHHPMTLQLLALMEKDGAWADTAWNVAATL